jgi:outer membrane protein, multidrug efflux system
VPQIGGKKKARSWRSRHWSACKGILSVCAAATVVSGCAGPNRDFTKPDVALPENYRTLPKSDDLASCPKRVLPLSTSVARIVAQAFSNNPDLASAAARIDQESERLRLRQLENRPGINAGVNTSLERATTGATATGALLEKLFPDLADEIGIPETASYPLFDARLTLTDFEIDLWGRMQNATAAAKARLLAEDWNRKAIELSLFRQVVGNYVRLVEIGNHARIVGNMRNVTVQRLTLFEKRAAIGLDDRRMILAEQGRLQDIDATLAGLALETAIAENELAYLTGRDGKVDAEFSSLQQLAADARIDPGLPSDLLLDRPDIRAAESELLAAQADINAARAHLFPSIRLTGVLGFASTALSSLFTGNSAYWSGGAAIDLPIFDLKKRRANVRLTEARERELVAQYQKAVATAFREVNDGLAARQWYKTRTDAVAGKAARLHELEKLAAIRTQAGLDDDLMQLEASFERMKTEIELSSLYARQVEAAVSVYASVGGGSAACTRAAVPASL